MTHRRLKAAELRDGRYVKPYATLNQNTWRSQSVILICEDTLIPIGETPTHMGCQRNDCEAILA